MNELNWLVVDKIQASKFEPEYKNVVAAFNSQKFRLDFSFGILAKTWEHMNTFQFVKIYALKIKKALK